MRNSWETARFGPFTAQRSQRTLSRDGIPVPVSPKVFDCLVYLLDHTGTLVRRTELLENLWQGVNVGETTLNRAIADLRKALHDGEDDAQWVETVPKFGYRFQGEVETAGVPEEVPAETLPPGRAATRRTAMWRAAVTGGCVLAILAGAIFWTGKTAPGRIRSLAVLPIETLGKRNEVLELGIADTLISRLGRMTTLEIRSLSSVRRYLGKNQDAVTVGRELHVDAVLEGSLQEIGSAIRINLRLVSIASGVTIWSAGYDERSADPLTLEDSIATSAAAGLALQTGQAVRRADKPTSDDEAYRAYLEGRYLFSKRKRDEIVASISKFEYAVLRDPGFAPAHVALAEALAIFSGYGFASQASTFQRVRAEANRALELDPAGGDAHRILALLAENYDYDRAEAVRQYRLALAAAPNDAESHQFYGELLGLMGHFAEAESEMETALRLDPVSPILQTDRARIALFARRYEVAEERFLKILSLDPTFERARDSLVTTLIAKGDCAKALDHEMTAARYRDGKLWPTVMAHIYSSSAEPKMAAPYMAIARQWIAAGTVNEFDLASLFTWQDDPEEALAIIERTLANHSGPGVIGMETWPGFDGLRSEPRFQAILRRMGAKEPEVVTRDAARRRAKRMTCPPADTLRGWALESQVHG